jgi:hypothetical protein
MTVGVERPDTSPKRARCAPDRERVLGLAGAAGAVQHNLVIVGAKLQPARETLYRPFQITVVKRHHTSARVTQQVMMMLAPRIEQLIARRAIPELQPRDQPMLAEQLEDPVDTRACDPLVTLTQPILDLQRTQCTWLTSEQLDQSVARPRLVMPRLIKHPTSVIRPLTPNARRH